ncbi:hypothetical protein [Desulfuromonas thiophila]|uniref:hypothetical protein n=1 Tax=Desulfuromonas thiophila TaxID=57664 RepID=UPI0024A829EB|nr:hypothetical protein [Desulfuromonas thiophila]
MINPCGWVDEQGIDDTGRHGPQLAIVRLPTPGDGVTVRAMTSPSPSPGAAAPIPARQLDLYSSAITLSDMEIFVYPQLLYSLVLANILSPVLWRWRDDPWFAAIDKLNSYRRILRLKQFIMDRYDFNLDLDSWGLTRKDVELERFKPVMASEVIARSNALFGYSGDKYYFDMDIRRHFGLDKYDSDIIPYWKTETVEAMDAFCYREGYNNGAGECVSLSTLYAAALFVVCRIPLEKIYLMATPLHSQNFVDVREGILTNNRRIVTKNMWFNGTALTARAQRALRNEQVTLVAHCSGHVHVVYPEATIDPAAYDRFSRQLTDFMQTELNEEILCNFLRQHSQRQCCFQLRHQRHGKSYWVAAEKVYAHERGSAYKVSDPATRDRLLDEVDEYDFQPRPLPDRFDLAQLGDFFQRYPQPDLDSPAFQQALLEEFGCDCNLADTLVEDLRAFVAVQPRLPRLSDKQLRSAPGIRLDPAMDRAAIEQSLLAQRADNPVVDLAFYAYRDLSRCDWAPFLLAALQRNPVCREGSAALDDAALLQHLSDLSPESIYEGPRLAQPDEVWNFCRGDGVERALCLACIWRQRHPQARLQLQVEPAQVRLWLDDQQWLAPSAKGLHYQGSL